MTAGKLRRIVATMESLRRQAADVNCTQLISVAKSLERTRRPGTNHLVYESPLANCRAVAITGHPSRPVGKGLTLKILNEFEADVVAWQEKFEKEEQERMKRTAQKAGGNGHV